jgi:phenylpyruvate tautomerase PptA (4-oxalocrotonate tautomerase family)
MLNLFQDNRRRLPVMLNQVQHDEWGVAGMRKNHFPTNNHMGYSSRVMQAAV